MESSDQEHKETLFLKVFLNSGVLLVLGNIALDKKKEIEYQIKYSFCRFIDFGSCVIRIKDISFFKFCKSYDEAKEPN